MSLRITASLTGCAKLDAHLSTYGGPTLNIYPHGDTPYDRRDQRTSVHVTFAEGVPDEDQVAVAERLLVVVRKFRDQVVAEAGHRRTTADELAAARAEIEQLKAAAAVAGGAA